MWRHNMQKVLIYKFHLIHCLTGSANCHWFCISSEFIEFLYTVLHLLTLCSSYTQNVRDLDGLGRGNTYPKSIYYRSLCNKTTSKCILDKKQLVYIKSRWKASLGLRQVVALTWFKVLQSKLKQWKAGVVQTYKQLCFWAAQPPTTTLTHYFSNETFWVLGPQLHPSHGKRNAQ